MRRASFAFLRLARLPAAILLLVALAACDAQRSLNGLPPDQLIEYLKQSHSETLRLKAVRALGLAKIAGGVEPMAAIATDEMESPALRRAALDDGLRYMNDPRAEAAALRLVQHPDNEIRYWARWVVSAHGTDHGVDVLGKLLAEAPDAQRTELLYCLLCSKNRKAGMIVFESCPFDRLVDERQRMGYLTAMHDYQVSQADKNVLKLINDDDVLVRLHALQYFGVFPREDVVPALLKFATTQQDWAHSLFETFNLFIASPEISDASRRQLQKLIDDGKVRHLVAEE